MICPDHHIEAVGCCCPVADDLIELSGKMLSDGIDQGKADEIALRFYHRGKKGQRRLFDVEG